MASKPHYPLSTLLLALSLTLLLIPASYIPLLFELFARYGVKLAQLSLVTFFCSFTYLNPVLITQLLDKSRPQNFPSSTQRFFVPGRVYVHYSKITGSRSDPVHHSSGSSIPEFDIDTEYEATTGFAHIPHIDPLEPLYASLDDLENGDILLPMTCDEHGHAEVLTAYKKVGQKVKPLAQAYPEYARTRRTFPEDPLKSLPPLPIHPPEFYPTDKLDRERMDSLDVNHDGNLTDEETKLFEHIMRLNQDALAFVETDRGTFREEYFSDYIYPVTEHTPWAFKNIPIPPGILDKVIELLKVKISHGVYEHSQSAYRSRWFCVLKKNGSLRIVHDLQPLNKVSVRDAGVPPILDEFVQPYAGCQIFTVFDLYSGFDARTVDPRSRDITAFMTPLGLLRLTCLPQGFTNSPTEFQQCMVFILQHEIPKVANIFIDDLPIKGPDTQYPDANGKPETMKENPGIRRFVWEHALDVHRVMHRVKHAGATFAAKKTQIARTEVLILGQICNQDGRLPDPHRVDKILNWPRLIDGRAARRFLGLCGGVRIWIEGYSTLVRPLSQLFHKDAEFVWGPAQEEAFTTIKRLVTSAPALVNIDYDSWLPVFFSVDSSLHGTGFVLSQLDSEGRRRIARYGSLPFNALESRYSQPKLELYGLYRALRHWRMFLFGIKKLNVEVDAKYIKGMLNAPDLQPNAAINRWIQGILLFDFNLIHVPGKTFHAPDALSRRGLGEGEIIEIHDDSWLDDIALLADTTHTSAQEFVSFYTRNSLPIQPPPSHATASVYINHTSPPLSPFDSTLFDIRHFLVTLQTPVFAGDKNRALQAKRRFLKKASEYYMAGDRMFKRNGQKSPLLVVFEPSRRQDILTQAHDMLGHRGEDATLDTIQLRFFWPHLRKQVHDHVRSCHQCQIRTRVSMQIPLTVSTPTTVFGKVYIDIMFMPRARGFRYIVAAKDDLSGVTEARCLRRATAKSLAKFFWEEIYCRYGMIMKVTTDNGSEVKEAFELLMKTLGVPHVKISPYNSRANGVVERGHFILRESVIKACEGNINLWPLKLAAAVFADRVTVRRATGQSPYYILHGFDPILPFDLTECTFLVEGWKTHMSASELLALRTRQIEKRPADMQEAAQRLLTSRFRSKAEFERRYHSRFYREEYHPDELVLVRNSRISNDLGGKHKPKWLGPYAIVRRTRGGSYVLRELSGAISTQGISATRLLPYISRDDPRLIELAQGLPIDGRIELNDNADNEMDVDEEEEARLELSDEEDL